MKNELLVVKSTPALFEANFEAVEKRLKKELKKYDVVVTVDTLKDCKELTTELNKTAKNIDDRRKSEVAAVSEPIKEFDDKMKSLVVLCKDGRQKLLDQIKSFEDVTRKTIKNLMIDLRKALYEENKVDEEFRTLVFQPSIPLNYLTGGGKLSGKIQSDIKNAVLADLQVQSKIEMRLLKLENESYKAGLKSPLTKSHVEFFLMFEEEDYNEKLQALLKIEVERQEKAEEVIREQVKKEKVNKDHPLTEPATTSSSGIETKPEPAPVVPEGKTVRVIQARFEVVALPNVKTDKIIEQLTKVMKSAGITSLKSIFEIE